MDIPEKPLTLLEIIRQRDEIKQQRHTADIEHQNYMRMTGEQIAYFDRLANCVLTNLDIEKIKRAQSIIQVHGKLSLGRPTQHASDSRQYAVNEAIKDLVNGPKKLNKEYFGVKNYDGFGDQGSDHPYGYGPRHGRIVFSVGLTSAFRNIVLTPEEIEDCVYYLSVLAKYEQAIKANTQV